MCEQMEQSEATMGRLVAAANNGDHHSRGELLGTVRRAVLRYALARGLPDADAHDLAQDTCLALLTALTGWRDQGRTVWALVFTIARNKLADRARAYAARRDIPIADDAVTAAVADPRPGPQQLIEEDEEAGRVDTILRMLPPTQRDVLMLRAIVGLSASETAAVLHLSPASVRVIQHRAVTTLRRELAPATGSTP
jgi:RNA polymerase sigma-70 factor, ECF subfamily